MHDAPVAKARSLVRSGDIAGAESVLARLIAENFGLSIRSVSLNVDWSSLNSLNGKVSTNDEVYFFKFHQEEGEEGTVKEYYRGELLQEAGYPVDMPHMVCRQPGRQILLYRFRRDLQLAAACLEIERSNDFSAADSLISLQSELDCTIGRIYCETLHPSDPASSMAEPIHQLFHARLYDSDRPDAVAGRVARYYWDRTVPMTDGAITWAQFSKLRWRINGVPYRDNLDALFARSLRLLAPVRFGDGGAVVAHGDAHNANVWIDRGETSLQLVMFDPAFAGAHVPALLAEVKATFHNIFAHPFWLYHPAEARKLFTVRMRRRDDWLEVEHDWQLNPLRKAFLESKIRSVWRPLLTEMRAHRFLPDDWQAVLRCALFACPTLVLNLLGTKPDDRTVETALLSFSIAVMAGSEPASDDKDSVSEFMAEIAP